jgi:hypothetical protein
MDVEEENEVSLLDLLVVIAENLKLLILGPLVAGLLALGIAFAVPQSYVSQAILTLPTPTPTPTPTQAAAMMVSPLVLDPVIESLNLSGGHPIQVARTALAQQVKAAVGKDGLLRLDVTANTPLEAQAIANAVIDTWLKSTVPSEQDRADMEKRLAWAKASLESVHRLLGNLTADGGALSKPLTRGEAGTSIVAVGELQGRYLSDVLNIPRQLKGLLRDDVVKQPPTLPTEPTAPKKGLIAVLSTLATGLALLLWVFMRQAWRNAALDPQAAPKLARLRAALGLK